MKLFRVGLKLGLDWLNVLLSIKFPSGFFMTAIAFFPWFSITKSLPSFDGEPDSVKVPLIFTLPKLSNTASLASELSLISKRPPAARLIVWPTPTVIETEFSPGIVPAHVAFTFTAYAPWLLGGLKV